MAFLWFLLILLCLLMYVSLDGYDLGIGIGTLFERDERHRRDMLEQVAAAWDGNETWLVLLAVALWAGFPQAFGTILPHAYLPMIVVLLSLIVRGVSVEMVSQAPPAPRWVTAFGIASLVAALAQGVLFGTLTMQLTVVDGAFSGSAFGAIGWFSVLAAATVTARLPGAGLRVPQVEGDRRPAGAGRPPRHSVRRTGVGAGCGMSRRRQRHRRATEPAQPRTCDRLQPACCCSRPPAS